jgi:hypothetical protein
VSGPVVLFIGGYGRSGSTLLDRLLGSHGDGVVSAGELRHVWREGLVENRRCGCGEAFADCAFWRAVIGRAFEGRPPVDELVALQARVDRPRHIRRLATGRAPAPFRRDAARYAGVLSRLVRAVAAVAGAGVVVDSTKDASHGWILRATPGIDLRVLHLTRDPRAVAWSWQRRVLHPGSGQPMDRFSPTRTALGWVAVNGLISGLRRAGVPSLAVRYEDLVTDPAAVVGDVLEFAGVDRRPAAALVGARAVLRDDHTVAGNPVRFARGEVELRVDDEWRTAMPARTRAWVGALAAPGRVLSSR